MMSDLNTGSLQFEYNHETKRTESNDPEIYVRDSGVRPQRIFLFTLHWDDREILFMAQKEVTQSQGSELELISWTLRSIDSHISGRGPYHYKNLTEREKAVEIMLRFLGDYDGHLNIRKNQGRIRIASVNLSEALKQSLHGEEQ